jgi:hypothetical protein
MKKIVLTFIAAFGLMVFANAQAAEPAKPLTKEEKVKLKQKQDEDMAAAYKAAGLTDDQIKQVNDALSDASTKGNVIKKDAALSEEDKKTKLKAISDEKNSKLKEIMGKDKYKLYTEARKKQKEQAGTN